MQAAVEIDFQGMAADEALRQLITKHIATLDERFGEITWCRVAIKAPSEHHHKGGLYEITLHIILPHGRAVDIDRTVTADERYADPAFAVNDAFKRALRRLVERARRQRGKVKAHNDQSVNGSDLSSLEPPEGRQESRPEAAEANTVNQSGKPA
jgi:ribosome-associated translation inhibitor RaiA